MKKQASKNVMPITGFKTSDGEFFADHTLACKHQTELDLQKAIYKFSKDHFYSGIKQDDCRDVIIEWFDEIKQIVWDNFLDEAPIDWNDC